MTQIGEGVYIPPPIQEKTEKKESEKKEKIKLRLCISFDGTLNNRTNTDARKANSEKYEEVKSSPFQGLRGHGSYENEYTNVAKLDKYVSKAEGYDDTFALYIEGAGTVDYEPDVFRGKAFGRGEAGIEGKAKRAFEKTMGKIVKKYSADNTILELVSVDLFGFSRGAATARYFINWILKECPLTVKKLPVELTNRGYEVGKVEVAFVGLYDTVASVGLPFQHRKTAKKLQLNAVKYAKKVIQLGAADEHRSNFSLSNIDSVAGKGKEIFLPGVHSDIGGGYTDGAIENHIIYKGSEVEVEADRKRLIEAGWYNEQEVTVNCKERRRGRSPTVHKTFELEVTRTVAAKYDRIPLHIMAEFARESGMTLKSKLENINGLSDSMLKKVKIKLIKYAKSDNSKPEDWQRHDQWLRDLRHLHLHFSASLSSVGMGPRIVNGRRGRQYFDG